MVSVLSTMQELGSLAKPFSLPDVTDQDRLVSLDDFSGKAVLLMFICNHCPYVIHVMPELVELANRAKQKGFAVAAISSNDAQDYPQDGPEPMGTFARQYGFEFPYLYDESQAVAKDYGAACTPDFFVFDSNHRLQYRGQMDDSRPGNGKLVTGADLQAALDAIRGGRVPDEAQTPSMGCNIKWRAGNEPDYF